jgi:hypothetical protein
MSWFTRLRNTIHPRRLDNKLEDLTDEMTYHRGRLAAAYREKGVSADEAHRLAALRFGNITRLREECREVWLLTALGSAFQNIRYARRMMRKNLGLTVTILITIALGIGANTAIFTVDYATLIAPAPYPDSDQVVMIWSKLQGHRN